MIQIITNTKMSGYSKEKYKISKLDSFEDFSNFDINVIDLTDSEIWMNKGTSVGIINNQDDFTSLRSEISTTKSKIVIIFPQNINFLYNYGTSSYYDNNTRYKSSKKIKDMIGSFINIIDKGLTSLNSVSIKYGKTNTTIDGTTYSSDFSFINNSKEQVVLSANNKTSVSAITNSKCIITTLNIDSEQKLSTFLRKVFLEMTEEVDDIPEWESEIDFYTDKECKKRISVIEEEIDKLELEKKEKGEEIKRNSKFKSILYETGDKLATEVNEIIGEMLEYDISEFIDNYEEDNLIKLPEMTFIIEIKGLNNEIRRENVHKAAGHLMVYRDKLDDEQIEENTKALFVVAYQRKTNPNERSRIDKGQLSIAKQMDTLIIDTRVLLKIYEDFKLSKITTEEIKKLLIKSEGELKYK